MNAFLSVDGISKQFGEFTALNDISLSINKGEFICFLGPSGCGKTTLLRIIAGLESSNSGEIWQNGENYTHLPPDKRDFGIVFQSYALFPNLTVAENIGFGLRNQGKTRQETKSAVSQWLEIIGLPKAGDKYPSQLSGGQQQRVALARALALSPGLLLLDEPLSALDAKVRVKLRETIRNLQKKLGITTIMVTHDQEEAMAMADRIVVMNHGHIEQIGTPQTIYQQPRSRFVAEFVGAMNFIDSRSLPLFNNKAAPKDNILGIRPEDISFENSTEKLPVCVVNIEFQGTFVRTQCNPVGWHTATPITVDVPIHQLAQLALSPGCHKGLTIKEQCIHQFTGQD
ncbi:putative 2-aminoethylphosphonate ABC transporter ATP-binding protein [Candidatus Sororendozoicomonas aggregata]|uniref:putative 2-aminoethylphosphonate ABC transporter ATP-binding protein n=1 Tax=Candidatus Sororendozoicomonas aggregata TaxID=3073239 RepID=UPI002ED3984E